MSSRIPDLKALNEMMARGGSKIASNPLTAKRKEKFPTLIKATESKKRSKYRNIKTEVNGIIFDSAKEAARYTELKMLERAGEIKDLQRQVKFSLDVNGFHICNYFADFSYLQNGELVVEDSKSPASKTRAYRIKAKLMRALFGISILET